MSAEGAAVESNDVDATTDCIQAGGDPITPSVIFGFQDISISRLEARSAHAVLVAIGNRLARTSEELTAIFLSHRVPGFSL